MKLFAFISILIAPTVMIAEGLPVIVTQPQDLISAGTFSVVATNAVGYQWRCNGVDIPGETNSILARSSSDPAGYYLVIVNNATGWVPSRLAYLTRGSGGYVPFSN